MNFRQWLNKLEHNQLNMGNTFDQGPVGDYKDGNNGIAGIRSKWQQKDDKDEDDDDEDDDDDCDNKEIGSDMGKPEEIFGFKHKDKSGRNHDEMLRLGAIDQKNKFMKKMSK